MVVTVTPHIPSLQATTPTTPNDQRHQLPYADVLGTIGQTPLVSLTRIVPRLSGRLFAKLEGANPGGSAKDRAAFSMIRHGLDTGAITARTTIIESSSGNMGIGLALACAYYHLPLICVVDTKATTQNLEIMRAYGADVHLIDKPDEESGELLIARLNYVRRLRRELPDVFWTNQYENLWNAFAHRQTMQEIDHALDGQVDYLFCATSTCGTIRGCLEHVRSRRLRTKVVAVDAEGSRIFGSTRGQRRVPGIGAGMCPELCKGLEVDRVVHISDIDCVVGCRRLVADEAILAGGSSGGLMAALARMAPEIPVDATCVVILPDRGDRYLETIYSDNWVSAHFPDWTPSTST